MKTWIAGIMLTLMAAGLWTDLRRMIIPNGLTAGFAAGGLLFHGTFGGWTGLLGSFAGGAAGMLPLLVLYRLRGMGAGDVKWFGAFGVWSGVSTTLHLLVYAVLFAGAISVLLLLLQMPGVRRWGEHLPWPWGEHPVTAGKGASFPFMLAVAPAFAWMMWNMGGQIG